MYSIRSRQSISVERGLTAEVQFRLPLTDRIDRQSIQICLLDEQSEVSGLGFDDTRRGVCVNYPQGELDQFSAEAPRLTLLKRPGVIRIPAPGLGGADWASLGIRLRPDGRVTAIVNGQATGELPEPFRFPAGIRANVLITGRAEDTELLFRSVTVWEGPRY